MGGNLEDQHLGCIRTNNLKEQRLISRANWSGGYGHNVNPVKSKCDWSYINDDL